MDEDKKEERSLYREFTVTPGMVGFKIRIGCSELYFGDASSCLEAISGYMKTPQATERRYQRDDQRLGGNLEAPIAVNEPGMEPRARR